LSVSVETNVCDGNVGLEFPADRDDPDPPQACDIQRSFGSVWDKVGEPKKHGRPSGWGVKAVPVGLPRALDVRGAQVQVIDLVVAEYVKLEAVPATSIDLSACIAEIKGDLKESAIVLEADTALHVNSFSTSDDLAGHRSLRNATHHLIGEQNPSIAGDGQRRIEPHIVDDLEGVSHGVTSFSITRDVSMNDRDAIPNGDRQSRLRSLLEAVTNVVVGYALAVATQIMVFPWFGIETGISEQLAIGLAFVGVSLARGYLLRRVFEWWRGG